MRVFISWAHRGEDWGGERARLWEDHVACFAHLLAGSQTADVALDLWNANDPEVNWNHWGPNQVDEADFVLIAMNAPWAQRWSGKNNPRFGAGATAEANALHGLFNENQAEFQRKVRLVLLPGWPHDHIPRDLSGVKILTVSSLSPGGIEEVVREIKNLPRHPRPGNGILQMPTTPGISSTAIPTFRDGDMLLLRFRDLHPGVTTLKEHARLIAMNPEHGTWWGWWKKPIEGAQLPVWSAFQEHVSRSHGLVGLFNSGSLAGNVTRALAVEVLPPRLNEFDDTPPFAPPLEEWNSIPKYYRPKDPRYTNSCAWIRLVSIDTGPCQFYGNYHFVSDDPKDAGVIIDQPSKLLTLRDQSLWHVRKTRR